MSVKDLVGGRLMSKTTSKPASGTFNEKKNIFADVRANINYFPLYLNVSSEDNVYMENTSKYS